jgi:hypothetical protein
MVADFSTLENSGLQVGAVPTDIADPGCVVKLEELDMDSTHRNMAAKNGAVALTQCEGEDGELMATEQDRRE